LQSCETATVKEQQIPNSIAFVINVDDSNCGNSFPLWLIVTICAGGLLLLGIIVIVLVLKCKKLTRKVFPFRKLPADYYKPRPSVATFSRQDPVG